MLVTVRFVFLAALSSWFKHVEALDIGTRKGMGHVWPESWAYGQTTCSDQAGICCYDRRFRFVSQQGDSRGCTKIFWWGHFRDWAVTNTYKSALGLNVELSSNQTIVFPAIAVRIYRWPSDMASEIAVEQLLESPHAKTILAVTNIVNYEAYEAALNAFN